MKYKIQIDNKCFVVEIKNLQVRPIVASVNGIDIDVWPESINLDASSDSSETKTTTNTAQIIQDRRSDETKITNTNNIIAAPIPGVVLSVNVKNGDEVTEGQELCIIEAMKMRNVIRTSKSGMIEDVFVLCGQTVNHGEKLVKFAD